jgi:hypothetical protein
MNLEVRPKGAAADAPVTDSPRRVLPPLPTTRAGMDLIEALRGALGALLGNERIVLGRSRLEPLEHSGLRL